MGTTKDELRQRWIESHPRYKQLVFAANNARLEAEQLPWDDDPIGYVTNARRLAKKLDFAEAEIKQFGEALGKIFDSETAPLFA
jgi:hypothetical protein